MSMDTVDLPVLPPLEPMLAKAQAKGATPSGGVVLRAEMGRLPLLTLSSGRITGLAIARIAALARFHDAAALGSALVADPTGFA